MQIEASTVYFKISNPRTVQLTGGTEFIRVHRLNDEITALEMPSGKIFALQNKITVDNKSFRINIIKEITINNSLVFELCISPKTKSSLLLMPMLGAVKNLFFYDQYLINCFIGTKDEGKGSIGLLYRITEDPLFPKFQNAIEQFKSFDKAIKLSDEFIYFKFKVPKKYKKDYQKFIDGEYSKFSGEYKEMILKFHKVDIESQIAQILYKGKTRKQQLEDSLGVSLDPNAELFSIINEDLELFDKNYYL